MLSVLSTHTPTPRTRDAIQHLAAGSSSFHTHRGQQGLEGAGCSRLKSSRRNGGEWGEI